MYNINKRTWRLLIGLIFVTVLVYLFQTSPFSVKEASETHGLHGVIQDDAHAVIVDKEKKAFVTFLCDDIMGEATEVLVYSLKKTKTNHDIAVLVLKDVTQIVRTRLEYLGAKIIDVDQIKYPWDSSSARRKGFNKACRYSKLNLWNLTQYKKVVFLDADTMVVSPIEELFNYPEFTAVVDIGGVLNTGVFVAEPNVATYNDIMSTYENSPSYNKGDQGFLNYYFNQSVHHLPGNYNLMVKFTHFSALASSFITENTVKVLHFTSETKPWNFYFLHNKEWRENYDGYLFGLWTRALRQMRSQLTIGDLWSNQYGEDDTAWSNKGRVEEICDNTLRRSYGRRYPKNTQFTVILNLNQPPVNIKYLEHILRMYASSKKVARVFINGNVIKGEDGEKLILNASYFRSLHLRKPIKAVNYKKFRSVNNRFNPIQGINTDAVFIADENVLTTVEDLEFGYEVWKKNQDAIVGFKSNSHSIKAATQEITFKENFDKNTRYSMISSRSMFMKSDFLYAYTCLVPEEIHHYIDNNPICHDIAINMLVSGMTGTSPVLIKTSSLFKFQEADTQTQPLSKCLQDLSKLFNGINPLLFNNQLVTRVSPQDVNTTAWEDNAETIKESNYIS